MNRFLATQWNRILKYVFVITLLVAGGVLTPPAMGTSAFTNLNGTYTPAMANLLQIQGTVDVTQVLNVEVVINNVPVGTVNWVDMAGRFEWQQASIPANATIGVKAYSLTNNTLLETRTFTINANNQLTQSNVTPTVDKTALNAAITQAQNLYSQAAEGSKIGQYPAPAKANLQTAITAALAISNNASATTEEVGNALNALNQAIVTFNSLQVPDTRAITGMTASLTNNVLAITVTVNPAKGVQKVIATVGQQSITLNTSNQFIGSFSAVGANPQITLKAYNASETVTETRNYQINSQGQLEEVSPNDNCFIATAAFGTIFDPAVVMLRHFRDDYLLTNAIGKAFVKFYYNNSPPLAHFIAGSQLLRFITRMALLPLIGTVYVIYHPLWLLPMLVLIASIMVLKRKHELSLS